MGWKFCLFMTVAFASASCDEGREGSDVVEAWDDWKVDFPEMPGDEYFRLIKMIDASGADSFLTQRFIFEEKEINQLAAIQSLFDRAREASAYVRPYDEKIEVPEVVFGVLLQRERRERNCSVRFGSRNEYSPEYSAGQMLARFCIENQIDIVSASPERFEFDVHSPSEPPKEQHPFAQAAEDHGLQLKIIECDHHENGIQILLVNGGGKTVKLGDPQHASARSWNPVCYWSLIPSHKSANVIHPYGLCEDRMRSGCGTGWMSFTGEILRIDAGQMVEITERIALPDLVQLNSVDATFRAKLYFLNYAGTPLRVAEWYSSESERARLTMRVRKTLSCYLVSNEIPLEAVSMERLYREHQKKLSDRNSE